MKYAQARQGRIFVIRLEDGEVVHEVIENFAMQQSILAASLIVIGCADEGSALVLGPRESRTLPADPMTHVLQNVHEVAGVGTVFPDDEGAGPAHAHSLRQEGRNDNRLRTPGSQGMACDGNHPLLKFWTAPASVCWSRRRDSNF